MADILEASERPAQIDPFSFHQKGDGAGNATPNWDPYGFHQNGPKDTAPKPGTPDLPQPRPDVPIPLPPMPDAPKRTEIRLPDGALNVKDELGRVVLTVSADGRKSRGVEYGDQSDPSKVTRVTIDNSRVYTRNADGKSWTCQSDRGTCTWYGDVRMSASGEYYMEDHRTGERRRFAANTQEIVDANTRAASRQGGCSTGDCSSGNGRYYYNPRSQYDYRSGSCYPQQDIYRDYYRQQQQDYYRSQQDYYRSQHYYRPQDYYHQGRYYDNGGCNSGSRFGPSFVASMVNSAMPYRSGWGYPGGGYYPGYHRGNIGGNIAGAVVGGLINRAIWSGGSWGGGRRGCRW